MRRPLCLVCLLFALTVAAFLWIEPPPDLSLGTLHNCEVILRGKVVRKEVKYGNTAVYLKQVVIQGVSPSLSTESLHMGVLCYMEAGQEVRIGSTVLVTGTAKDFGIARNPGEFDARAYYALSGVHFYLQSAVVTADNGCKCPYREFLFDVKCELGETLNENLSDENAAIMRAILLGDKSDMDAEVKELYQKAGIAHVLAISGLHISLLGMGLYKILKWVTMKRWLSAVIALLFIVSYGTMVGFAPSILRAIGMFALSVAGENLKRSYDMLTAMALMAVLILIGQPMYIVYGGFQLSFGAILGLGIVYPAMLDGYEERSAPKWKKSLCGGFSVTIATLPVMLFNYGEVSLYSVIFNLLVIPLLTFLVTGGMALLITAYLPIISFIRVFFGMICEWILPIYRVIGELNRRLPLAVWRTGRPDTWQMILYGALLLAAVLLGSKKKRKLQTVATVSAVLILLIPFPHGFTVTFLDVGQGDGACVTTFDGYVCMIDGGSLDRIGLADRTILPFFATKGITAVDYWFLTHPDIDHTSAFLEIAESDYLPIRIKNVVLPRAGIDSEEVLRLKAAANAHEIRILWMEAGDEINLGNLKFSCLYPKATEKFSDVNDMSLVLCMTYQSLCVLFTGDSGKIWEEQAASREINSPTILKVAHHGSATTSNTEPYLRMLSPQIAVISCGKNNRYGHPHTETLHRLEDINAQVYRTDKSGAVTVKFVYGVQKIDVLKIKVVERIRLSEYNGTGVKNRDLPGQ